MFKNNNHFDSVEGFLGFYGLEFEGVEHEFAAFKSGGFELAGHIFKPAEYKAVVFILHGFLDHTGSLKNIIEYLTGMRFAVACFDLPGHGLSSGEPTAIDDFGQYSDALCDFVKAVKPKLKAPYHMIGHSTGASAVIDYLLEKKGDDFDKVILVAPLIKSVLWKTSNICSGFYRLFGSKMPRVFRNSSHDKNYLTFVKNKDPLQAKQISVSWVKALYEWNKKIAALSPCSKEMKVIQGTEDTTVVWRFNMEFIKEKFPKADIALIKHGRHELFNESEGIQKDVFFQTNDYFKDISK